jgi:hypothetical protein
LGDTLWRLAANRRGDFVFIARADDRGPAIDHFLIYPGDRRKSPSVQAASTGMVEMIDFW